MRISSRRNCKFQFHFVSTCCTSENNVLAPNVFVSDVVSVSASASVSGGAEPSNRLAWWRGMISSLAEGSESSRCESLHLNQLVIHVVPHVYRTATESKRTSCCAIMLKSFSVVVDVLLELHSSILFVMFKGKTRDDHDNHEIIREESSTDAYCTFALGVSPLSTALCTSANSFNLVAPHSQWERLVARNS